MAPQFGQAIDGSISAVRGVMPLATARAVGAPIVVAGLLAR